MQLDKSPKIIGDSRRRSTTRGRAEREQDVEPQTARRAVHRRSGRAEHRDRAPRALTAPTRRGRATNAQNDRQRNDPQAARPSKTRAPARGAAIRRAGRSPARNPPGGRHAPQGRAPTRSAPPAARARTRVAATLESPADCASQERKRTRSSASSAVTLRELPPIAAK